MGEQQQQEATVKKSASSSTALAIVLIAGVAGAIAWLGWGEEIKGALAPKPVQPVATAAVAKPAEPPKPRPTVTSVVSPKPLGADKIGAFNFGGVFCWVIHYNERWNGVDQQVAFTPDAEYPRQEGNTWEMKGKWSPSGSPFAWHHIIQRIDPQTLSYDLSLKSDEGVQTNGLAMGISLPTAMYSGQQLLIDGEPLKLPIDPATPATAGIFNERTVNSLEIATPVGRFAFEGPITVMVQDNRAYNPNDDAYLIRINFTPSRGVLTDAQLKFKVRQVLANAPADTPEAQSEAAKPIAR